MFLSEREIDKGCKAYVFVGKAPEIKWKPSPCNLGSGYKEQCFLLHTDPVRSPLACTGTCTQGPLSLSVWGNGHGDHPKYVKPPTDSTVQGLQGCCPTPHLVAAEGPGTVETYQSEQPAELLQHTERPRDAQLQRTVAFTNRLSSSNNFGACTLFYFLPGCRLQKQF